MVVDRAHVVHYAIIVGLIVLGIAGTTLFSAHKGLQLAWVIGISLFYLFYGILHHYLEHDLTIKIVVEYVLVVALVISLFMLMKGGG